MISGGRRPLNSGMSRPFGYRPMHSNRRYMNRNPGWGYGPSGFGGNDAASLCCLLLCISNIFGGNSGYYDYGPYYSNYDNYNSYNTTQPNSVTQGTTNTANTFEPTLCPQCGEKLRPEDAFCTNCGNKRPGL